MSKRSNSKRRNHHGLRGAPSSFSPKSSTLFRATTAERGEEEAVVVQLLKFEITWDVMPDRQTEALPESTRDRMQKLFDMLHEKPRRALPELRELAAQHPEVLSLRNWLVNALRRGSSSDWHEAFSICEQLFLEHPNYFFGRTTLADLLLDQGRVEDAAKLLFGKEAMLTRLYPGRKVFHISEIRHWAYLSGRIKILQGEPEIGRAYRNMLNELEPGSPPVQHLDSMLDRDADVFGKLMAGFQKLKEFMDKRAGTE